MASKYFKGFSKVFKGPQHKGRVATIAGVKPKSRGAVDEFKSRKLKEIGKKQRTLKSQDKEMGKAIEGAKKKGVARKDLVKGRKVQRDSRRLQREGDKLKKDVLRLGKAKGGQVEKSRQRRIGPKGGQGVPSPGKTGRPAPKLREQIDKVRPKKKPGMPVRGKLKKQGPKPGTQEYVQENYLLKPGYKKDREMKKDGGKIVGDYVEKKRSEFKSKRKDLKKVKPNQKGLKKLPTEVRNKMGYMKKGGRVRKFGGGKK